MGIDKDKSRSATTELRRSAEEQLNAQASQAGFPLTDDESQRLLHELQVHQIELEMQNEELRQARGEVDTVLAKYTDFYDFAPVGYLILDSDGTIRAANHNAAALLKVERSRLIGQRFGRFVVVTGRHAFAAFLGKLLMSPAKESCEVALAGEGDFPCFMQVEGVAAASGQECRIALIDITERRHLEGLQAFLARTGSVEADLSFFEELARYLGESLAMDFVCIDRLEGDGLTARTVAVWCDGHFEDNVTYALKDTPCGDVVGKTVCCFPAQVCQFFPRDQVLKDLRADSYVGVTLWSHAGQPIGLIAVIGRRPLTHPLLAESILKLVAVRAAGELERLDAEVALRASEERHRAILQTAIDGFWLADRQGRLLEVNETYCQMSGYSMHELLGMSIPDLEANETTGDTAAHIRKVMEQGTGRFESRHRRKDGSIFYVEVSVQYLPANGECFVAFLRDVTAHKRMEELTAHLASFPQLNPNPVLEVDRSGRITFFNPATVKILATLGMDEADIAAFLPSDMEGILASWDRVNEATFRREIVIKDRAFGETISLTPQFKVARIYTHDITDRKLAENVTHARLRMLTASANLSMDKTLQMTLDEIEIHTGSAIGFYHFLEADQETLSLQAWSSNTLASMCTAEGKGNHYPISRAGVWVDCVQARRPVIHNDYAALPHKKGMPPGHARVVREMLIPIVRKDRIVAIIGVGNKPTEYTETDIEIASLLGDFSWEIVERRRGEEAVKAANRELEAFSYSVSHDLRAPLRAIDGFSKILLDKYHHLLDEKGGDYLQRVRTATQKMAQLIDDLLKLSRLTRGGMNLTSVDLSLMAGNVATELKRAQAARQVSFAITAGLVAQCDQHLLKVVLDNLLGNAWKFTAKKEQAVIEFGSTLSAGTPIYFVRDNGAGFDMAYVDKLFGTFQRLHLEQDFPGTGIGLSLVHRIIQRHGGKIWAEGAVDQGATFYFTLTPMKGTDHDQ